MSSSELGTFLFAFALLLGAVTVSGHLFERLRQPKLVGEILAGILLGPFVLGRLDPAVYDALYGELAAKSAAIFGALYWAGLLLLMFLSGTEMKRLFAADSRREVGWLCAVGTLVPFALVLALGALLPVEAVANSGVPRTSVLIVLAVGVAVTSIPVISRIFHDLGILNTRFAALILGAAALDDVVLWGALAVATALAHSGAAYGEAAYEVAVTLTFMAFGFFVAPAMLRRLNKAPQNILARTSPLGYAVLVLLAYTTLAASLGVDLVFAAFLAGYGLMAGGSRFTATAFGEPLEAVKKVAFSVFIPMYFALIGQKLIFGRDLSWSVFLLFLAASTLVRLLSAGAASYLAGFRGLVPFNIAMTLNARGGPGIVLASVAYEAGIINASFYTALVLTALVTSQAAGAWLMHVLRRGWPLLGEGRREAPVAATPEMAA